MAEEKTPRYDYISDDANNAKAQKKTKKRPRKSDHKHHYIDVLLCLDTGIKLEAKVCDICGRLNDFRMPSSEEPKSELPEVFVDTGGEHWISFLFNTRFVGIPESKGKETENGSNTHANCESR